MCVRACYVRARKREKTLMFSIDVYSGSFSVELFRSLYVALRSVGNQEKNAVKTSTISLCMGVFVWTCIGAFHWQ